MFDSKLSRGVTQVVGRAKLSTSMSADVDASLEINHLTKSSIVRHGDKLMKKQTTTETDHLTVRARGTLVITGVLVLTLLAAGLMSNATHG